MIETETDEDIKLGLKNKIAFGLNQSKIFISAIESNLEHEDEEIQKKTVLIAIAFIKAVSSIDMEETKEIYKQFKQDKKNGH